MRVYDYETKTTFWDDFTIAEVFGISAILDTFALAFSEWKNDYVYLTELVMVLNWKIWQHYQTNDILSCVYNELWEMADEYACNTLTGDELSYFYRTTD